MLSAALLTIAFSLAFVGSTRCRFGLGSVAACFGSYLNVASFLGELPERWRLSLPGLDLFAAAPVATQVLGLAAAAVPAYRAYRVDEDLPAASPKHSALRGVLGAFLSAAVIQATDLTITLAALSLSGP